MWVRQHISKNPPLLRVLQMSIVNSWLVRLSRQLPVEWSQRRGTIFSNPPWPEKLVAHLPASFQSICKSAAGKHGCQTTPPTPSSCLQLIEGSGSLVAQWLGLCTSTAGGAWVPSLELKFPHSTQHGQKENFLRTHQTLRGEGWG